MQDLLKYQLKIIFAITTAMIKNHRTLGADQILYETPQRPEKMCAYQAI